MMAPQRFLLAPTLGAMLLLAASACGDPDRVRQSVNDTPDAAQATASSTAPVASTATPDLAATATALATSIPASPTRSAFTPPPAATAMPNRPEALNLVPGQPALGGKSYRVGGFTFVVPLGRDFTWGVSLNDPGGYTILFLIDEKSRSSLKLHEDGSESGRVVNDPTMTEVFDAIVASIELTVAEAIVVPSDGIVIYDEASGSSVKFSPDTGKEVGRYVTDPKWEAIFDASLPRPAFIRPLAGLRTGGQRVGSLGFGDLRHVGLHQADCLGQALLKECRVFSLGRLEIESGSHLGAYAVTAH